MLDELRRRLGTMTSSGQDSRSDNDDVIRVLALTRDPDEWHTLQRLAADENWIMLWAHCSARAREIIATHSVLVVICDRDLPQEDWKHVFDELSGLRPLPCLLLASEVADDYLWREVVQHGGFEILTRPFEDDKVVRMIRFAANWRGWAHAAESRTAS